MKYRVFVSRDNISGDNKIPDERWHVSITPFDNPTDEFIPTWQHVTVICHSVRPGVPMVIGIPPRSWWINIHPYCIHVVETKDANLIDQWRVERRSDTPS